jgi:hypothetical protein
MNDKAKRWFKRKKAREAKRFSKFEKLLTTGGIDGAIVRRWAQLRGIIK